MSAAPAFDGSQVGPPVGYFSYSVTDDTWSWSDGIYELHGYAPHAVPASTELLLRHKHPDDRARAYEVLETAVITGRPFSCYHRIVDAKHRVRSVLSVGRGHRSDHGTVERVTGFFADLSAVRRDETQAEVEVALLRIAEHRAVIEQAKGVLMLATGCDAEEAFGLLRRSSSTANIKLNQVAHRLVEAVGRELRAGRDTRGDVTSFLAGLASVEEPSPVDHVR